MNRRDFLKKMGLGTAAAASIISPRNLLNQEQSSTNEIKPIKNIIYPTPEDYGFDKYSETIALKKTQLANIEMKRLYEEALEKYPKYIDTIPLMIKDIDENAYVTKDRMLLTNNEIITYIFLCLFGISNNLYDRKPIEKFFTRLNKYTKRSYKTYINATYIFPEEQGYLTQQLISIKEKIEKNIKLKEFEQELAFLFLRSIWINIYNKENPNNDLPENLNGKEEYPVSFLIYFTNTRKSNLFREGKLVLTDTAKLLLERHKVSNLPSKSFPEDIRVYIFMRHMFKYYVPLLKAKLTTPEINDKIFIHIDRIYEATIEELKDIISKILPQYDTPENIKKKRDRALITHIRKQNVNGNKNPLYILLNRVIDIGYEFIYSEHTLEIKINLTKINSKLISTVEKYAKMHGINSKYSHALNLIESRYLGDENTMSQSGAKGSMQLIPATYKDMTKKSNFKTATNDEIVEAGTLKIIHDFKLLNLDISTPINDHDNSTIYLLGVLYNAGQQTIIKLLYEEDFILTEETRHYYQFLFIIKNYIKLIY